MIWSSRLGRSLAACGTLSALVACDSDNPETLAEKQAKQKAKLEAIARSDSFAFYDISLFCGANGSFELSTTGLPSVSVVDHERLRITIQNGCTLDAKIGLFKEEENTADVFFDIEPQPCNWKMNLSSGAVADPTMVDVEGVGRIEAIGTLKEGYVGRYTGSYSGQIGVTKGTRRTTCTYYNFIE